MTRNDARPRTEVEQEIRETLRLISSFFRWRGGLMRLQPPRTLAIYEEDSTSSSPRYNAQAIRCRTPDKHDWNDGPSTAKLTASILAASLMFTATGLARPFPFTQPHEVLP